MKKPSISILIPAFNEQDTLETIVKRIITIKGISKEIIIVNDGSSDNTGSIANSLAKRYKSVQTFHHRKNKGKGASIITALKHSKGEIVITQDADLEYNPKDYPKLIKPFKNPLVSVVYGTREKIARKGIYSNVFFYLGGEFLTLLANLLYGIKISDEATGYKLFRREVLQQVNLKSKGFEFCPEVTAKVSNLGYDIVEVPIRYVPRPFSEGKKIRPIDGIIAIKTLIKHSFITSHSSKDLTAGLETTQLTRNYNTWIFETFAPYLKGVIFEAGAGLGTFAEVLLKKKYSKLILGEINNEYVNNLRRKFRQFSSVKVVKVDLSSSQSLSRISKLDTIICINTLEHIKNDQKTIINLANKLKVKGHLIIFVPAFQILFSNWDKSIGHFRRYSKNELINKLEVANLQLVKASYFNSLGFFGWGLNKLIGKTPKNNIIQKQILFFDRFIVPWWSKIEKLLPPPFGQSLLIVAKKIK